MSAEGGKESGPHRNIEAEIARADRQIMGAPNPADRPRRGFEPEQFPPRGEGESLLFSRVQKYMQGTVSRPISKMDVEEFALVSLDTNPVHLDEKAASRTLFESRIAHGILTFSHIKVAIKEIFGNDARLLSFNVEFQAPVKIDDRVEDWAEEIATTLQVVDADPARGMVTLSCSCSLKRDVITGKVIVELPKEPGRGDIFRNQQRLWADIHPLRPGEEIKLTDKPRYASFEGLAVGDVKWFKQHVSAASIGAFKGIVGLDETTPDSEVPLTLLGSYFSAMFGTRCPGMGAIYISQSLTLCAPLKAGEEVDIAVRVKNIVTATRRVTFECEATNKDGRVVALGEAKLWIPEEKNEKTN